jgi:hypothetical protein
MDDQTVCRLLAALLFLAASVHITNARPIDAGRLRTKLAPRLASSDLTALYPPYSAASDLSMIVQHQTHTDSPPMT